MLTILFRTDLHTSGLLMLLLFIKNFVFKYELHTPLVSGAVVMISGFKLIAGIAISMVSSLRSSLMVILHSVLFSHLATHFLWHIKPHLLHREASFSQIQNRKIIGDYLFGRYESARCTQNFFQDCNFFEFKYHSPRNQLRRFGQFFLISREKNLKSFVESSV